MKMIKIKKSDDKTSFGWAMEKLNNAGRLNYDAASILKELQYLEKFLTPEEKTKFARSVVNSEKVLTRAAEAYRELREAVRKWK